MSWIVIIGWVTKAVLVVLAGLSVWSIAIVFERRKAFAAIDDRSRQTELKQRVAAGDADVLKGESGAGIRAEMVKTLVSLGSRDEVSLDHATRSRMTEIRAELERGLTVLATLGSNAPFIGLFGTVLGIIQAFGALADKKGGDMNLVMFLIAEALLATAVGLFVAIPAVVSYNVFQRKLRVLMTDADILKELYLSRLGAMKSR